MTNRWHQHDIDTLSDLWSQGRSAGDIAKIIGCSRSAVLGKINRLGLQRGTSMNPNGRKGGDKEDKQHRLAAIHAMRVDGYTAEEIAKRFGYSPHYIRLLCHREGLTKVFRATRLNERAGTPDKRKARAQELQT